MRYRVILGIGIFLILVALFIASRPKFPATPPPVRVSVGEQ